MRRFLGTWALLFPAYLVAAGLSSWLVLDFLDLTYEAFAAWLLVPPAQALVLTAGSRRGPLLPPGRPPAAALAPVVLALGVVAAGLARPAGVRWEFLVPGNVQALLPRVLALIGGIAFLSSAFRARRARLRLAAFGAVLLALGFDAAHPFLATLPARLLPRLGLLYGGLVVYGGVLALLFLSALAAQRALEEPSPWAARLVGASLAVAFAALQGALLQLFLHPWLETPWAIAIGAAVAVAASLAAGGGLAALLRTTEGA